MKNKLKILVLVFVLALVSTLSIYAATIFNSNAVSYNNNTSGMKSTNVQDAIDELYLAANSDCKLGYSKGETTSNSYACNKNSEVTTSTINFDSSHVAYDNSNGMEATTVQGAIDELASRLSSRYCIDDYEKENETSTSYTCVQSGIRVTFDANGGTFSNNETTNVLTNFEITQTQEIVTKYSHTSNVNDTGLKKSNYGNSWTNANITGTDRGDTTKAHVVTIPGASSLTVDIYYNGESVSWDWATVWEGSHPEYTAASNYSSGVTNGTKLGGSQSGSYTVNGNSLTSMGYSQFTISGDSVTFGFKSDSSEYGQGYGYYAIVSGTGIITTQTYDGTYSVPTRAGYVFKGWLSSVDGNIYSFEDITPSQNTTYTAQWEPDPAYCPNNATITVASGAKCKRAMQLHVSDGKIYGQCGTKGGDLVSGDALDCDVNGDGKYTERFYYVSDYYNTKEKKFESDTAVLIYYNSVDAGVPSNSAVIKYYSPARENWHGPVTALAQLPTTTQWSNVGLKNTARQILTETGTTSTTGGALPIFSYAGYAARLLTTQELESACGITVGSYTTGELDTCRYLTEGDNFWWLETPRAANSYSVWYVRSSYRLVSDDYPNYANLGARPAIEILKSEISK